MKRYIKLCCVLLSAILLTTSCKKEKALEPSNEDENYFVVTDNPNNPVDHSIYQFFTNTGIPVFYKDTIGKKRIPDSAGIARYTYITLSINYGLFGNTQNNYTPLSSKAPIPAFLDLLKEQLLPRMPAGLHFNSILLIDSFIHELPMNNLKFEDGWTTWQAFNTVAIMVKDVTVMNNEEKKMYVSSILAGIADKQINSLYANELQRNFYSISRTAASAVLNGTDIYIGLPFFIFTDPSSVPAPEKIGFLRYMDVGLFGIPDPYFTTSPPNEANDLRAFLTASLNYTTQEFNTKYVNEELVLKKYGIIKNIAKQAGFKFPD